MIPVLLVVHLLLAIALVVVILLQRSEGGALGIGGGGGFMTARGSADLLTKTTAVIAGMFMLTSITLAVFAGGGNKPRSVVDETPAAVPAQPTGPCAPLAQ